MAPFSSEEKIKVNKKRKGGVNFFAMLSLCLYSYASFAIVHPNYFVHDQRMACGHSSECSDYTTSNTINHCAVR